MLPHEILTQHVYMYHRVDGKYRRNRGCFGSKLPRLVAVQQDSAFREPMRRVRQLSHLSRNPAADAANTA